MICKQMWFNKTLAKMFSEILKQLFLLFLNNKRFQVQPTVRCGACLQSALTFSEISTTKEFYFENTYKRAVECVSFIEHSLFAVVFVVSNC